MLFYSLLTADQVSLCLGTNWTHGKFIEMCTSRVSASSNSPCSVWQGESQVSLGGAPRTAQRMHHECRQSSQTCQLRTLLVLYGNSLPPQNTHCLIGVEHSVRQQNSSKYHLSLTVWVTKCKWVSLLGHCSQCLCLIL